MFGGSANRARHIIPGILIAGALLLAPRLASAATMFLSPGTGTFGVGRAFTVTVRVNSQGTAINASEGRLSFNPALLQVISVSTAGSIFNLNVQEPEFSNATGTVRWAGIILNPGFNGTSGQLLTVNFKGVAPGTARVDFASGAVLANDGAGTNVLSAMSGGSYTIGAATGSPTPTPTPSPSGLAPDVVSPTHPDPAKWYSNNDPEFQWELPSDVDNVSFMVNVKPDANPGNVPDGLTSSVSFSDIPDGANHFHIKFLRNGVWSPITHFGFNVDMVPPDAFTITRTDEDDTTNPRPLLTFVAEDATSGIAKYLMRIGNGDWFEVPESLPDSPFAMPLQAPGDHEVTIEALDAAGNAARATLLVRVASIGRPVITRYPEKVPADTAFEVAGTSPASVTVQVKAFLVTSRWGRVLFNDEPSAVVDARADASGRWTATIPGLDSGRYRIEANSIDERGAVSDTSDPVAIRVGYGIFHQLWDIVRGLAAGRGWLLWLAWVAIAAVLILLLELLWHRMHRTPVIVVGKRDERKSGDKLQEIADDIAEELAILSRIEKNRPLYPEEKYLRSKLMQYRKTLKFLLSDTHSRLAK